MKTTTSVGGLADTQRVPQLTGCRRRTDYQHVIVKTRAINLLSNIVYQNNKTNSCKNRQAEGPAHKEVLTTITGTNLLNPPPSLTAVQLGELFKLASKASTGQHLGSRPSQHRIRTAGSSKCFRDVGVRGHPAPLVFRHWSCLAVSGTRLSERTEKGSSRGLGKVCDSRVRRKAHHPSKLAKAGFAKIEKPRERKEGIYDRPVFTGCVFFFKRRLRRCAHVRCPLAAREEVAVVARFPLFLFLLAAWKKNRDGSRQQPPRPHTSLGRLRDREDAAACAVHKFKIRLRAPSAYSRSNRPSRSGRPSEAAPDL